MAEHADADAIFLDTSIRIASRIHRPEIRDSIAGRTQSFARVVSGLVVRQEVKRRLLGEAQYLLRQLNERGSFYKVRRHLQDSLLSPFHFRKRQINLQLMSSIDEQDLDVDLLDRTKLMLRDLLRNGIATGEASIRVNEKSGCACAKIPVIEKVKFKRYDLGPEKCSQTQGKCEVVKFLDANRNLLIRLHAEIKAAPTAMRTEELQHIECFIELFLEDPAGATDENPCLTVADLLIALESSESGTMYTMNVKESRVLTRALGQQLIYRHPNSDHPEYQFSPTDPWTSDEDVPKE